MADLNDVVKQALDTATDAFSEASPAEPSSEAVSPPSGEAASADSVPASSSTEAPSGAAVSTEEVSARPEPATEPAPAPATASPSDIDQLVDRHLQDVAKTGRSGRENWIPYSRVRKITEKAVRDAVETYRTQLSERDQRLQQVAEFERILYTQPQTFLQILSMIPTYQPLMRQIEEWARQDPRFNQGAAVTQTGTTGESSVPADASDPMPPPNQILDDGSPVYDANGLKAVLDWHARQLERKLTTQFKQEIEPIRTDWQVQRTLTDAAAKARQIAAEVRTWQGFSEHEAEIVALMRQYPTMSIEEAYRRVVVPRLVADRDAIRKQVLQELRQAPRATAASTAPTVRPLQPVKPTSLTDIIKAKLEEAKQQGIVD